MSKIIKVDATEELLKIYFFKLYSRKGEIELNFDEETIHTIIVSNTIKTIKSADLFKCCSIEYRWGDEPIEIPNSFYYFEKEEILDNSIQNHPFLYTNIKTINNTSLVEAEINLQHSGSDIYDDNNNFLELTICPNLYDNGIVNIKYLAQNIFSVFYYDENNGERYELFLFKENRFHCFHSYKDLVLDNKNTILQLLSLENCPPLLAEASESLRADKEVVLAAVSQNGEELEFASKELQSDREVILTAVKNSSIFGSAFEYASEELKSDREFILEAVKRDGRALKYASEELRSDREIVLEAIKFDLYTLAYASKKLMSDRSFILEAVKNDGWALKYASEELRSDREIIFEAVKSKGRALEHASEGLKSDREIVLEAVKSYGRALQYASEELRSDREIVLEAIKIDGSAFQYCTESLKKDEEFICEAYKLNLNIMKYMDTTTINENKRLQELENDYKSREDEHENEDDFPF
jgi:predicted RNA-binding protein (virulence factor B family)